MNARQLKALRRFHEIGRFLDENAALIPPGSVASQRQILLDVIREVDRLNSDALSEEKNRSLVERRKSARHELRLYVRQLSAAGLEMLTGKRPGDPNVPKAKQIFAAPRGGEYDLLLSAQVMVRVATAYAGLFETAGVSLKKANAAVAVLQSAATADQSAKRTAKGARHAVAEQLRRGEQAVRQIDVVIRPRLASDEKLVALWKALKRVSEDLNSDEGSSG